MGNIEHNLQGVSLDIDGSTLNTPPSQFAILKQLSGTYSGTFPYRKFGDKFLDDYNRALETGGMVGLYTWLDIDFKKHGKAIWKDYTQFNQVHPAKPVPGMRQALQEIHRRSRVSPQRPNALRICANTTKTVADIIVPLQLAGLWELLDSHVTKNDIYEFATNGAARRFNIAFDDYDALRQHVSEEVIKQLEKPNALGSMMSIVRLGVPAANIIAVEDNYIGARAFQNVPLLLEHVDIPVAAVTWGYEKRESLARANPRWILDKPSQLVELIGDLGGFR